MAYTFLKTQGIEVGTSLVEKDQIGFAGDLLAKAKDKVKLLLPGDHVAAERMDVQAKRQTFKNGQIPLTGSVWTSGRRR